MTQKIERERKFTITFPRDELVRILREAGYKIPDDGYILSNSRLGPDFKLFVSWVEK